MILFRKKTGQRGFEGYHFQIMLIFHSISFLSVDASLQVAGIKIIKVFSVCLRRKGIANILHGYVPISQYLSPVLVLHNLANNIP